MQVGRTEYELRRQLEDSPAVLGPWEIGLPGFIVMAENLGDVDAELHIKGGPDRTGPFVREYGSDTILTIKARARMVPVVITDIAKFIALHLTSECPDGVRVALLSYYPVVHHDLAHESVTVV